MEEVGQLLTIKIYPMAQQGKVTKIYELKTVGFEGIHTQFQTLSDDLLKIKKLILELQGKSVGLKGDDLAKVNQQLAEALRLNDELEQQAAQNNQTTDKSISKYFELNKAYKEAKNNAQDLAAEYGVESDQAKAAAESAAALKQQLVDINNLVKNAGKTIAPVVPLTAVPQQQTINTGAERSDEAIAAAKEEEQAMIDLAKSKEFLAEKEAELEQSSISAAASQNQRTTVIKEESDADNDLAQSVSQVTTKYEEYTGTLRQNILAQIENNAQLTTNRAAQKDIQKTITEQGTATQNQLNQLAALREEEQILIETNKALTLTVRNQTKEFIASAGSLDEMQAQINQLQQSYESLTAQEKASPFGQRMKAEIDLLEPKVKSLEAELGKFQRNVGNYPTVFGGAFKVLETELDTIKGKLIAGNFNGKDLDELTAKEKVLTTATETLGQTFATTSAEANAVKEAGRQISQVYGTDSVVFKQFSTEVAAGNTQLKATDAALLQTAKSGGGVTGVFSKIFSGLRNIANIIPGLGLGSLILLLITPLQAIASEIFNIGKRATEAKGPVKDLAEQQKALNDALASNDYTKAIENVNELRINIDLAKQGFIDKKKVVDQYNETIGKTTGQVKNLNEAEKQLGANADAYIQFTLLKAAANITLESAAKKAADAAIQNQKDLSRISRIDTTDKEGIGEFIKSGEENLRKAEQERSQGQVTTLKDIAADFQKQAAEIAKKFKFNFFQDIKPEEVKKQTDVIKDGLTKIDTLRDTQLAKENERFLELKKDHELTLQEEIDHLNNIEKINLNALDSKIKYLTGLKKLNADELKTLAEFRQQRVEIELKTNDDIQKLREEQFQRQVQLLKDQLEGDVAAVQEKADIIVNNPIATPGERAKAKLDADNQVLALQQQFNQQIDELEKQLNAQSIGNAKQGASQLVSLQQSIRRTKEEILKDQLAIANANLTDINDSADKLKAQFDANYNILRQKILENDKLTAKQRKEALDKLEQLYQHDLLANELARLTIRFNEIKKQYDKGLADEKAFLEAKAAMEKAKADLDNSNNAPKQTNASLPSSQETQNQLKDRLSKEFGFKENSAEDQLLGNVIASSFQVANDAMNAYFDAEQARIQQSLAITQQRIDLEKQQSEARAQSQAEIDSIEKQAAAKTKAAQKQAGEELKKVKKSEARVALATELANIAVSAAANPLNGVTFGAAGAIMYGLLAALAVARYAINVSAINREQFAYGGQPGQRNSTRINEKALSFITPKWYGKKYAVSGRSNEVPLRGGKFGGRAHTGGGTDFKFKGRTYNAEVDELSVIRTRNAPKGKNFTVSGTQSQIASAINVIGGGHDFAPGAEVVEKKKNIFTTVTDSIKKTFGFGGHLTEKKTIDDKRTNIVQDKTITNKKLTEDKYASVIDKVMSENKTLVENSNISEIISRVVNNRSDKTSKVDTSDLITITRIVNQKVNDHHSAVEEKHYSTIVDQVMNSNKSLVERRDHSTIQSLVLNEVSNKTSGTRTLAENKEVIHRIINKKLNDYSDKVYSVTGSVNQIYKSLHTYAKEQFAFGGNPGEVPIKGGEFGGKEHAYGGTDFYFKGKKYNAEVKELAVIRTRNAERNKVYTVTGNQMQLASFANRIGGGIDFKPGARSSRLATGGFIGDSLQAPQFIPSSSGNASNEQLLKVLKETNELIKQQSISTDNLAKETSERVDRLQVQQVTSTVTDAQKKLVKQNAVGTL
jgi:hypothetical protein